MGGRGLEEISIFSGNFSYPTNISQKFFIPHKKNGEIFHTPPNLFRHLSTGNKAFPHGPAQSLITTYYLGSDYVAIFDGNNTFSDSKFVKNKEMYRGM